MRILFTPNTLNMVIIHLTWNQSLESKEIQTVHKKDGLVRGQEVSVAVIQPSFYLFKRNGGGDYDKLDNILSGK